MPSFEMRHVVCVTGLPLTRHSHVAVEDAVDERAFANTGTASDEHIDLAQFAQCFFKSRVKDLFQVW